MRHAGETFFEFLQRREALSSGQRAAEEVIADLETLWRNGTASAGALADLASEYYDLTRAKFDEVSRLPPHFGDLSRRYLKDGAVYPFKSDEEIVLAVADPTRSDTLRAIKLALGVKPALQVISFEEIEMLFSRTGDAGSDSTPSPTIGELPTEAPDTAEALKDLARGAPIVRIIDAILERAVEIGATDIHLETERDQLRVRLRVDGLLRREKMFPLHLAPAIISRIKILASLDIADRRLPQDGRANLRIGNVEADLRVAVMPTIHGETAVVRILLRDSRLLEFSRIGMSVGDQRAFEKLLDEPHGMIVVTGPTGSGKTTTLATAVNLLNLPSRKIVTVEDPIEYQIPGVHQTQIKPQIGLTFASALRSFLRHDPDVIMVGEMRDGETASIGIQAALTGHLVLTTLHTNSAVDAVIRLTDLGVEPYLVGAGLRGVLGQRLVRRLCDRCRRPSEQANEALRDFAQTRCIALPPHSSAYSAPGCEACGHTGYRGRIGIFEVLRADEELRGMIRHRSDPAEIVEHGRQAGMRTMLEDGLAKCASGLTSTEEVLRATD